MLSLRPARLSEAESLTGLCMRSKAVWGYDAEFMTACRAELTITEEKLVQSAVQVAELDGRVVGMARLSVTGVDAELEALFVDPRELHAGIGRALFEWAVSVCRTRAVRTLAIEADPGAAAFYRRMGAVDAGLVPSGSIAGRFIPKLTLSIV